MRKNDKAREEAGFGVDQVAEPEATYEIKRPDYVPIADLVQANIDGQRLAAAFIDRLHSQYLDPDTLAVELLDILKTDLIGNPRLRGFVRRLQKQLERGCK
jgi:hypothetical protein